MTITAEFEDAPVCHDLGVVSGGWEGTVVYIHPSICVLNTFLGRRWFLGNSVWRRAMLQPLWDGREELGPRCCAQAFVRVVVGNVCDGSLNGSHGGNYKPGNRLIF